MEYDRHNSVADRGCSVPREWFGLRQLGEYADVSERTLRTWVHQELDPLPAVQVRGKILVSKKVFDSWLQRHMVQAIDGVDVNDTVKRIVESVFEG